MKMTPAVFFARASGRRRGINFSAGGNFIVTRFYGKEGRGARAGIDGGSTEVRGRLQLEF